MSVRIAYPITRKPEINFRLLCHGLANGLVHQAQECPTHKRQLPDHASELWQLNLEQGQLLLHLTRHRSVFVILLAMPTQENPQLLETLQYRAFAAKVGAERRLDHTV